MINGGDRRTAPATPDLLKIYIFVQGKWEKNQFISGYGIQFSNCSVFVCVSLLHYLSITHSLIEFRSSDMILI